MRKTKKILSCMAALFITVHSTVFASDLSDWAVNDYKSACSAGLISHNVVIGNMHDYITREEFCELAVNLYTSLTNDYVLTPEIFPFDDSVSTAVAKAYSLGIVSGITDTSFCPDEPVTREQISKILVSVLLKADVSVILNRTDKNYLKNFADNTDVDSWAENSLIFLLKNDIMTGTSDTDISPHDYATREQAIAFISRTYQKFSNSTLTLTVPAISAPKDGDIINGNLTCSWNNAPNAEEYRLIVKDGNARTKIIYTTKKLSVSIPKNKFKSGQQYSLILQTTYTDGTQVFGVPVDFTLSSTVQSDNTSLSEKEKRVFENGNVFTSKDEAENYMSDITVNVWKINSEGKKYPSTLSLTVNRNLADDIISIFDEIFNDPSQFPIKSAGCFQWRNSASGRLSQHSYGTCIDINPNENYYVSRTGQALSGSYWKPGEDPYSVTEDGIVVKTFAKYGFAWGGNAWGENSAKDYMHFSYLGN